MAGTFRQPPQPQALPPRFPIPPGGTQTLQPLSIASPRALGTPTIVAGAVTIQPLSLASPRALGTPTVRNVQTIQPTSIPAHRALGVPTIKPGPNYVRPESIPAHRALGNPTVVGGVTYLEIFVGAYNRTPYYLAESASLESQTLGRWTARLELRNVPYSAKERVGTTDDWTPQIGQTIIIKEFGRKYFAGCLVSIDASALEGTGGVVRYRCVALDKSSICDHRIVTPVTFTADQDAADVIRFVVTNYLNGEGITTAGVPLSMGLLDSDIPVNFWTVTAVFDYIQTLTGYQWYVDINGVLTWVTPTGAPAAPFNISTMSMNYLVDGSESSLQVTSTLLDYRNEQYVVSNRNVLPGDGSNPATVARSESFTLPYPPSVDLGCRSV